MTETNTRSDWRPLEIAGMMSAIGPLLAKRDGPHWRYGLETDQRHANAIGVIHGGTLTALADQAMSLIAWHAADRNPVVTVHMDAAFLSSARPGDFIEANAEIVTIKGSMIFLEASISSESSEIMKASCVMKIVKPRQQGQTA